MIDTTAKLDDPDAVFEALMEAHRGLDDAASRRLDARIVLLLANQIGSAAVVRAAVAAAVSAGNPSPQENER